MLSPSAPRFLAGGAESAVDAFLFGSFACALCCSLLELGFYRCFGFACGHEVLLFGYKKAPCFIVSI